MEWTSGFPSITETWWTYAFDIMFHAMVHGLIQGAIMRAELFMYFYIKNYSGTQGIDT